MTGRERNFLYATGHKSKKNTQIKGVADAPPSYEACMKCTAHWTSGKFEL